MFLGRLAAAAAVEFCVMVKMPAMSEMADCVDGVISADGLWAQLRDATNPTTTTTSTGDGDVITLLDCRSAADFGECHIRRAVHLSLPSIMLRRLAGGKVTIGSVLKSSNNNATDGSKRPFLPITTTGSGSKKQHTFVLCGGGGEIVSVLRKSLIQDGCPVVCLQGEITFSFYLVKTSYRVRHFVSTEVRQTILCCFFFPPCVMDASISRIGTKWRRRRVGKWAYNIR